MVRLPRGCYSDDSQLRLATGRAIRPDGFDVEAFAKVELPVWLSYLLGPGKASRVAARNLSKRGVEWYSSTFRGWSQSGGNGASMRIQPHVWASPDPSDELTFLPDVIRNSVSTHPHPTGIMGAVIHAFVLARTMATGRMLLPEDVLSCVDVAARVPDIIRADNELGSHWLGVFERECGSFDEAWAKALRRCGRAIRAAGQRIPGEGPAERYGGIIDRLGLRESRPA